jgi:hypothetical protein
VLLTASALIFIVTAGLLAFQRGNRRFDWKGILFAAAWLFFSGTALARVIWIQFYVLT